MNCPTAVSNLIIKDSGRIWTGGTQTAVQRLLKFIEKDFWIFENGDNKNGGGVTFTEKDSERVYWKYQIRNFLLTFFSLDSLYYREFHKTWQLLKSFECLLPYIILDIKTFCIISLKHLFSNIFYFEIHFTII